ncbi:MAG: hypothetical protein ACOX6X_03025 [Dethiobacteria bacterium]|jgi:hypothetical protein
MKIISFQDKKRKKIEDNLERFQEHFWEWVFTHRWKPCPECTSELLLFWGQEHLWSKLCSVCCSYFYYYQVLYVRALKTVCERGRKIPTFQELETWYFEQEH